MVMTMKIIPKKLLNHSELESAQMVKSAIFTRNMILAGTTITKMKKECSQIWITVTKLRLKGLIKRLPRSII
jgi:hypothetical protein